MKPVSQNPLGRAIKNRKSPDWHVDLDQPFCFVVVGPRGEREYMAGKSEADREKAERVAAERNQE